MINKNNKEVNKTLSLMERVCGVKILSESIGLLLEAMSIDDVYNKYYSKLISSDDFKKLVKADPTTPENQSKVGKFVKWMMNLYKSNNLKMEDLYKATQYISTYIKFYNKLPQDKKDINKIKSLPELFNVVSEFMENPTQATSKSDEVRKIKSGETEVFYEDDTWKVIIPKTKAAACEYGKGTQWCTAADNNNQFDNYSEQGKLYILINKKNKRKYQFHFESGQFMDEQDDSVEVDNIGLTSKLWNDFKYLPNNKEELFNNIKLIETNNFIFYYEKTTSFIPFLNKTNSEVYLIDRYGIISKDEKNNFNLQRVATCISYPFSESDREFLYKTGIVKYKWIENDLIGYLPRYGTFSYYISDKNNRTDYIIDVKKASITTIDERNNIELENSTLTFDMLYSLNEEIEWSYSEGNILCYLTVSGNTKVRCFDFNKRDVYTISNERCMYHLPLRVSHSNFDNGVNITPHMIDIDLMDYIMSEEPVHLQAKTNNIKLYYIEDEDQDVFCIFDYKKDGIFFYYPQTTNKYILDVKGDETSYKPSDFGLK